MKLPSFSFLKKTTPKEYFLALLLGDEMLKAIVFEENAGAIHIVGEGKSLLPAPLDDTSFEELLAVSDKAISTAESSLPQDTQSHKTIFGVKDDWTEELQISKDHLATLKKLCDELDLQPIGFLVFAEAIAHLLQKEEGAPASGILVELGIKHISATLLRAGRIVASKQCAVSENLPQTVDTLLKQFSDAEILPSRIILLDHQKRAHIAQQFTNYSWSSQLPFLHVPQVTPLADGFETQAILFGTATQMGFDMLGLPEPHIPPTNTTQEESTQITDVQDEKEPADENYQQEETIPEPLPNNTDDEESAESLATSGDNFGFVKDMDVLEASPKNPIAFSASHTPDDETEDEFADETFGNIPEEVKENEERSRLPGMGANGAMITEGMKKTFSQLRKIPFSSFFLPIKQIFRTSHGIGQATDSTKKLVLIIPVILLIGIGSVLWYIFGLKATATLFINPKNITASQGITFSSVESTNVTSDTIGGTTTPITENGSASTPATGSQDVGDKAKGSVTIYNNDTSSHTVASGTTITSANGLKFITNKDITIASASGDIFSGTKPGTQTVDVIAADIGTDYNLPSGTKFALGSSSILAGKNDSAFSGGTKKTVTIVSQKDLDKLTSDLTNNLGDKAKQDVQNNTSKDKAILSTFISTDMSNQKYDKKAGDQASNVTLTATITYQALSYVKTDLDKTALAIIQSNNQGQDISAQNISEEIQNQTVSKDGKNINATLVIKAGLLPKIDSAKVAQELAGKSFAQAAASLPEVSQLTTVQGVLSPNLFFLPKSFPRFSSHITVGVKANE